MICKDCGSKEITSRKNFTHGSKSKGKTTYRCNKCSSSKVEMPRIFKNRR